MKNEDKLNLRMYAAIADETMTTGTRFRRKKENCFQCPNPPDIESQHLIGAQIEVSFYKSLQFKTLDNSEQKERKEKVYSI